MRITQRENNLAALHVGFVAHADHIHLLGKSLRHALDGIVRQRARQTVQRRLVVRRALSHQGLSIKLERDPFGNWRLQNALGALNLQLAVFDVDGDALGNRYRFFTNARHRLFPTRFQLPIESLIQSNQ